MIITTNYFDWKKNKDSFKKQGIKCFWKFMSKDIQFKALKVFFDKFLGKSKKGEGYVYNKEIDKSRKKWKYKISIFIDKEIGDGSIFVSPQLYEEISPFQTVLKIRYTIGKFNLDKNNIKKIYIRSIKIIEGNHLYDSF
jgi:hypothetical protein